MAKSNSPKFYDYISKFQKPEFPFTLHSDLHLEFSSTIEPLPTNMIEPMVLELAGLDADEMTEFIPLFRWEAHEDILVLILWKASLLSYEYFLMTYHKNGELIDKHVIAGQKSDGQRLLSRVASIDNENTIVMIQAETDSQNRRLIEETMEEFDLEITPSGFILKE